MVYRHIAEPHVFLQAAVRTIARAGDCGAGGNFNAKFIQEMAKHGFDTGTAWSGAFTDSMHFELVTGVFSKK